MEWQNKCNIRIKTKIQNINCALLPVISNYISPALSHYKTLFLWCFIESFLKFWVGTIFNFRFSFFLLEIICAVQRKYNTADLWKCKTLFCSPNVRTNDPKSWAKIRFQHREPADKSQEADEGLASPGEVYKTWNWQSSQIQCYITRRLHFYLTLYKLQIGFPYHKGQSLFQLTSNIFIEKTIKTGCLKRARWREAMWYCSGWIIFRTIRVIWFKCKLLHLFQ